MTEINVLNKGDRVLTADGRILAIQRKNGTVDVYRVVDEETYLVDPVKIACIGYGSGTVSMDSGETEEETPKASLVFF